MNDLEGFASIINTDESDSSFNLLVPSSEESKVDHCSNSSQATQEVPRYTCGPLTESSGANAEHEDDTLFAGLFQHIEHQPSKALRIYVENGPAIDSSSEKPSTGEASAAFDSLCAKLLFSLACYVAILLLASFLLLLNSGNQTGKSTIEQLPACSFISRSRGYISFARFGQVPVRGNTSAGLINSACRKRGSTGRLMDKYAEGVCKVIGTL